MALGLHLDRVGALGRRLAVCGSGESILLLREVQKRGLNPRPRLPGCFTTRRVLVAVSIRH